MYNRDIIILLIQTDLPEPVVPATKRCGIDVKSTVIGVPENSFPRAIGQTIIFFTKTIRRYYLLKRYTSSLRVFGISIPTVFLPGMTDTLVETELVCRAISSKDSMIFETFTPGAGSNSYKVTTGPLLIFFILP